MNAAKGEETIFAEALTLPPEERAAYLAQATEGRPELRRRVETLLGSYRTGEFLEKAASAELRPCPSNISLTEKPGDTLGRYKLLQQIGEGGCGVVYVAEQTEPVRRRVALKIIKLGMDTKSVIARFEAERQALALMDHPNIAKVFDAGATETGRPYFVMELVRGMKITEFCDEKKLSTRERLDLFIQVCQAIQHAHQKGIIHRDIKPSNILVSMNDGVPVPKVIDFGIAKATSGLQLTDRTVYTAFEQFIGTPAYMSPEQAVLTSLDIDTRSDIYGLGVLLYELLTGKTPFDAKELLAIGLDEMRRTIREQEPPRPSTRLSTLAQNELSTTAQRRGLEAPKLVSELRGDLDWIVMKALEKDRARRYETANGLAADVQRHLNNEPVVACPPSKIYRLRKTVRRNKLAFTAAAAVLAVLAAGVIVSAWQAQRAKAERDSAEAVLKFFRDYVLAAGRPEDDDHGLGKDVTLRKAIDAAESQITTTFKDRPLVEAAIRNTLGDTYSVLGEQLLAVPQAERTFALRWEHLGPTHRETLKSMASLGRRYVRVGNFKQGVPLLENALKLRRNKLGPVHSDTLGNIKDLADALFDAGKPDRSITLLEEGLRLSDARLGPDDSDTLDMMSKLASAYGRAGKTNEAVTVAEEALQRTKTRYGPEHQKTVTAMNDLAVAYIYSGKLNESASLLEKVLDSRKLRLAPDHPHVFIPMHNLATALFDAGKTERSVTLFEELLRLERLKLGSAHKNTLLTMARLADAYRTLEKTDKALELLEELVESGTAALGRTNPVTLAVMNKLGFTYGYDQTGKQAKMIPLLEETVKLQETALGPNHTDTLITMDNLARAYAWAGRFDEAVSLLHEIQSRQGLDDPGTLSLMNYIGVKYRGAGKLEQAIALWEQTYQRAKRSLGLEQAATDLYTRHLASAYRSAGKLDQLETLYREQLAQQSGPGRTIRFDLGKLLLELARSDSTDPARRQDLASEGERLVREYLAGVRIRYANDPVKLDEKLYDVAEFRYRQGNYAEAETTYREIVELRRAGHKDALDATASLARLLSDWAWLERGSKSEIRNPKSEIAERAREAERLLRWALELRLRESTNSWRIGDVKSRLGGALVCVAVTDSTLDAPGREAKFSEAESLLLGGYEWIQNRSNDPKYSRDARERIDRLYEAWNKPDRLSEWKQKDDAGRLAQSALSLLQEEKFAGAEAPARASLAIREKHMPEDWRTFNARSMLGGSLLGQKKYAEAEPLLLSGYDGMMQREKQIPSLGRPRLKETLQRLVQLCEETNRPDDAAKWKRKLAEFEQAEEQQRTALKREAPSQNSISKTNHPPK